MGGFKQINLLCFESASIVFSYLLTIYDNFCKQGCGNIYTNSYPDHPPITNTLNLSILRDDVHFPFYGISVIIYCLMFNIFVIE